MKILDATTVIAFLSEMQYPEGFELLSKHYELIVPQGVVSEITKSPSKELLSTLVKKGIIKIVNIDNQLVQKLQNSYPQLHSGECEVIAYAQKINRQNCIISDDRKARSFFKTLNFKWTERLLDIMKEKKIIDERTYNIKIKRLQDSSFYSRRQRK